MTGYRVIFGITASIGLHVGSMVALRKPAPIEERPKTPTVIELAALPPPDSPPPPPEPPPPPPEPAEQKPEPQPRAKPVKAAEPPPPVPPLQNVPPTSTPLVLAGLSMSNAGVSVPSGYGATPLAPRPSRETSTGPRTPEITKDATVLTPVSDLSRKPVPPQLDTALAQFYPPSLRNQGIEGEALIRVVLGKDGKVAKTSALSESHSGFAPACEKALRTSRWEPPIDKSGNPTMTAVKYRCRFKVNL